MPEVGVHSADFVLFVPVGIPRVVPWDRGPLPLENMPGTPYEIRSDQAGRKRYVPGHQVPAILWGSSSEPTRWHSRVHATHALKTQRGASLTVEIIGAELFLLYAGVSKQGVAVVHGRCVDAAPSTLVGLVELSNLDRIHGQAVRALVEEAVAPASLPRDVRRAQIMTLVQPDATGLPEIAANLSGRWTAEDQWLWYVATCHLPGTITVGQEQVEALRAQTIAISDDWRCFSAVEGTAYIGRTPTVVDEQVLDTLRQRTFRFRTMEVDAYLLAEAQDLLITDIADELYQGRTHRALSAGIATAAGLQAFRNMYWGDRIAERGLTNELFRARRVLKDIPTRLGELRRDVAEAVDEAAERRSETTSAALGVLAVVGLPFSTTIAVWAAFEPVSGAGLGVALGLAVVIAVGLIALFPGLRSLVGQAIVFKNRRKTR